MDGGHFEDFRRPKFLYTDLFHRLLSYICQKSHQTLRPRSCRVNQKFGPWISDYTDCNMIPFSVLEFLLGLSVTKNFSTRPYCQEHGKQQRRRAASVNPKGSPKRPVPGEPWKEVAIPSDNHPSEVGQKNHRHAQFRQHPRGIMHKNSSTLEPDNSQPTQISKWSRHDEMGFPVRYDTNLKLQAALFHFRTYVLSENTIS